MAVRRSGFLSLQDISASRLHDIQLDEAVDVPQELNHPSNMLQVTDGLFLLPILMLHELYHSFGIRDLPSNDRYLWFLILNEFLFPLPIRDERGESTKTRFRTRVTGSSVGEWSREGRDPDNSRSRNRSRGLSWRRR